MKTNTISLGTFVIDNEPSADIVDALDGSIQSERHAGLLSSDEVRALPFAFSLAQEVTHPGLNDWQPSYDELESYRESALHAQMRRLVAARALRSGLRVFPRGIGIQGIKTFADLLITDGRSIVFVECHTHLTPGIAARKRQLEHVAPVVFVVAPDESERMLGQLAAGTVYLALPHLGTLALPGAYTGELCARCGIFVPSRSFCLFHRIPADHWPDDPWAVPPLGRRALVCKACGPALAEAVRETTKARWDAAFLERSRVRDLARRDSEAPKVAAELQQAWNAFRKRFDHARSNHAEALPSPAWRETELGPLPSELASDYGAWSLGAESRLWNVTSPLVVSHTDSDHYDFHRTGTAEARVGHHRLVVEFKETTRFQFTFGVVDGTKLLEGPFAEADRCSACSVEGCGRCIEWGDYSVPEPDPGKRCREAFSRLLSSPVPASLVSELQVPGVGPATLTRLQKLDLTGRDVVVRDRWEPAVADVPRLRQQQAEVRRRLVPRLLEGARYSALLPSKHGRLCVGCRSRVWSRKQCLAAFCEGWKWMDAEWEALARP
ncbi:hypothetical protein [Archangium sp.]|uniref:hypothetical protein n=1 Tax=Archangium sp. TaxID=1872627 RepID=UPI00286B3A65|nr:hypothetical protein [Archangium sp.]